MFQRKISGFTQLNFFCPKEFTIKQTFLLFIDFSTSIIQMIFKIFSNLNLTSVKITTRQQIIKFYCNKILKDYKGTRLLRFSSIFTWYRKFCTIFRKTTSYDAFFSNPSFLYRFFYFLNIRILNSYLNDTKIFKWFF